MTAPDLAPSGQLVKQESLWETAPAWRNLTIAASLLTFAAVALPVLLPQPEGVAPRHSAPAPKHAGIVPRSAAATPQPAMPAPTISVPARIAALPPSHLHAAPKPAPAQVASLLPPAPVAPQAIAGATPYSGGHLVSAPAMPQSAPATEVSVCTLAPQPTSPILVAMGTVIGFEDRALSLARIPLTEAQSGGKIDPDYIDNQRVDVRQNNGMIRVFIVPKAMHVTIGDRVTLQSSYRNMALPCNYIPVMVASDIGPPPAAESITAGPQK